MAFVKDMLRMWAHSWKRFISIAMITLLGVAVLTGIYAGCRDAFRSTDRFFDAQGLHDVQVLSTAGLSNGDIAALRKVNGVAKVQAERSQEVTFDLDGRKSATMQEIGTNGIDQPYLQEGRMPKKAGEIAVTRKFIRDSGKRIGSRLTVTPESASSDTSDTNDTNGADGTELPDQAHHRGRGARSAEPEQPGRLLRHDLVPFHRHHRLHVLRAVRWRDRRHLHRYQPDRERLDRRGRVRRRL